MESSVSPLAPQAADDQLLSDQTILVTPKPQACSTVNRRPLEPFTPFNLKQDSEQLAQSPSYLLNAIAGMRRLTDQLGILHELSEDTVKMPPPSDKHLLKEANLFEHCDSRRVSVLTESEANSSLGILKLEGTQGFSETENAEKVAEILSNFREEYLLKSAFEKENVCPELSQRKFSFSSLNNMENELMTKEAGYDSQTSSIKSKNIEADLRLRLQRELAQRTIDRSSDSFRLSQLGDSCDVDAMSMSDHGASTSIYKSPQSAIFSSVLQTPSPASQSTFGAANFLSFSSPPVVTDSLSSENFQPADTAFQRLEQDENSWRQRFDDLPAGAIMSDLETKSDVNPIGNLTQNLDISTFSGIVGGNVTMSSSVMEDIGKRRLSVGEYFQLRTECLGGVSEEHSEDQRPNFGNSIRSPPKRRPHPPLVNLSSSQGEFLDDIPTRDAGLNSSLNSAFSNSLNFSFPHSNAPHESSLNQDEDATSRSVELMPPPPPPEPTHDNAGKLTSAARDSVSSRLSVSLSLPRDKNDSKVKDLNSSALSLDSGEKLLSISQIVNLMKDDDNKIKSARQLVDEFMQRCHLSPQKIHSQPKNDFLKPQNLQIATHQSVKAEVDVKNISMDNYESVSPDCSPSRNQRVKAWISSINISGSELNLDYEDLVNSSHVGGENKMSPICSQASKATFPYSSSDNSKAKIEATGQKFVSSKKNVASEGNESLASFMAQPDKQDNAAMSKPRLYSTPKVLHGRERAFNTDRMEGYNHAPDQNRLSFESIIIANAKTTDGEQLGGLSVGSQDSDLQSIKSQESHCRSSQSNSKPSSWNSFKSQKSFHRRSNSQQSDSENKSQVSAWKYNRNAEQRPPSTCGSAISSVKGSSRLAGSLLIESTHTQLSWASVAPGSSVSQTFALRNKASARVRLLVSSPNSAFKLMGEHGEVLSELMLTLHSEETRRIHVVFTPSSSGPTFGKLVISRVATSESALLSSEDRRLIALYGYGGVAELTVEGASKDLWAQLFLNMCAVDTDVHNDISDANVTNDSPQMVATFSVRNSGKVPAFISLQVAAELPFSNCGVYVTPEVVSLLPGESERVLVRFDPDQDVLQWLSKNAADMQLLANIWISWSELATWQRIRRIFLKYYKTEAAGPLSTWGPIYDGDIGVGRELKDNKSSEAVLAQSVRRLKVSVLIERDRLSLFDLDSTMVFDQLVANETAMFESPQWNDKTIDTTGHHKSPACIELPNLDLVGNSNGTVEGKSDIVSKESKNFGENFVSPVSSSCSKSRPRSRNLAEINLLNDLIIVTSVPVENAESISLEFPSTTLRHKSKINITLQNPSSERDFVSILDLSQPFTVSTPRFYVPANSYFTVSVMFRPVELGLHYSTLNILVNEKHVRSYQIKGEGAL